MSAAADLIMFGEDWGRHPSSTQHLAHRLAKDHRIIWVNSIGLRRPKATGRDVTRAIDKLVGRFRRPPKQSAADALPNAADDPEFAGPAAFLSPLAVPVPGNWIERSLNRTVLGGQIRRAMAKQGIDRPIFWTSLPTAAHLVGSLSERAVVYYCGDDFSALAGVDHDPVARDERALVERADLILAASSVLAARFPSDRTVVIPHGVDTDLFGGDAPRAEDLPEGDGPIAGFYGAVADWIDVEMLATAADRLPHWRFVLIGPVLTDVGALAGRANVRFLGEKPHHMLPGYTQHWTASLLPFRRTPQIEACNPLKLREYLAAGRPVISTDFPALAPYRDVITVVSRPGDLVAALLEAGGEPRNSARIDARRQSVAAESWDERSRQVAALLERL